MELMSRGIEDTGHREERRSEGKRALRALGFSAGFVQREGREG